MGSTLRVAALVLVATVALAAPKKGAAPAPAKKPPPPPAAAPAKPTPPPPSSNGGGAAEPAPSSGGGGVRGGASGSPASRKGAEAPAADSAPLGNRAGGPTRVDFDDRLVQGQSTKQGAIYLFERKENPLRSMLRRRENFRSEIAGSIQ